MATDLSTTKPGIFSALRALVILFVIVLLTWLGICLFKGHSAFNAERADKRYANLKKLNEDNAKKLTEYAWIDKTKGSVQLPIDQAMAVTVRDLASFEPHPAYPVATPLPATPEAAPIAPEVAPVAPEATPAAYPITTP